MSLARILPIAKDLAALPGGMCNGDLAAAAGISAAAAGAYLNTYVHNEHLFKGQPEGKRARYFDTAEKAEAFKSGNEKPALAADITPEALARQAVAYLRNKMLSSSALAVLCKVPASYIDAAVAPLAEAGKLTRVSVLRSGTTEFDYRWASTWVPQDEDYALCHTSSESPKATVSPVLAPKPPVAAQPAPAAPAPTFSPLEARCDPQTSGKAGARSRAQADALDKALQTPGFLGWSAAPQVQADHVSPSAFRELVNAIADVPPQEIDADDVVCALNSRGELALDVGIALIKFKPRQALALTRFLGGVTVLEQMAARGEL